MNTGNELRTEIKSHYDECIKSFSDYGELIQCIARNLKLELVSNSCIGCFVGLSICIIKECSASCFDSPNYYLCERCTKISKCSLARCNSPNYLPQKIEPEGIY